MHLLPSTVRLAAAATCSGSSGVSVVVDFHELGGGVQTACVAGGGQSAAALFGAAGFPLTYVQRQPGFVCQVSGLPASSPCVSTPPTDAYWGLWWSDGSSGQWTYATRGASSQSVPDGGYVAFSWNGTATRAAPGVAPATHPTQASTPTSTPSPTPSQRPTPTKPATATSKPVHTASPSHSSKPGAPPTRSASPSAVESAAPKSPAATSPASKSSKSAKSAKSASAESPTESAAPTSAGTTPAPPATSAPSDETLPASSDQATPSDGGLPTWVGPAVVALLFAAGAAVAVVRRRGKLS